MFYCYKTFKMKNLKISLAMLTIVGMVACAEAPAETATADTATGVKEGKVTVNGANVTTADLGAGNGVVQVIDAVILPK